MSFEALSVPARALKSSQTLFVKVLQRLMKRASQSIRLFPLSAGEAVRAWLTTIPVFKPASGDAL